MFIRKFLFLGISILILSACGDTSEALTNGNGDAKEVDLTTEQQKVIDEYKKFNDEKKSDMVLYKYSKDFMGENSTIENHDEIKKEYSKAVETIFLKDINSFYNSYNKQVDFSVLDYDVYTRIMDEKEKLISQLKSEITTLISNEKFEEINLIHINSLADEDEELNAMYEYGKSLFYVSQGGSSDIERKVSPRYTGKFSSQIKELVTVSREKWLETYNDSQGIDNTKIPVTIGLTPLEVQDKSSWGSPLNINRTETINSVREQWVYPNNNYLYFEDGYLISIQSSR